MKKKDPAIIVEQDFTVTTSELWNALTDLRLMKKWYFENIPDFKPVVGFETKFSILSDEKEFIHLWKITEVIPYKKISYNWKYENYPGNSDVVFELFDEGDIVLLKVTVLVYEDFPDEIPEFKRESCISGWNYFIKERLKNYFEGKL